jgi:hypothetical protein
VTSGRAGISRRAWLAAAAAALLLLAALAGFNPLEEQPTPTDEDQEPQFFGGSGQPAVLTLRDGDLGLDYPSTWRVFRYDVPSSFSRLVAYLGTIDVPDPCERTTAMLSCDRSFRLQPGSVVVTITAWGFPGRTAIDQPAPGAVRVEVGGLPGLRESQLPFPETGADEAIAWRFARPDSIDNWYEIRADIRGPGVEALLAEVQALVDSVRYGPATTPGPSTSP